MVSETAAAGFASKNVSFVEFRSFASPAAQRATANLPKPGKNRPIGLPSTPLSAPAKKERATSRSTKLCSSPASSSSPGERAPPIATSIFVQGAVESNHVHLVLTSSPPIPAASADAAGISTSILRRAPAPAASFAALSCLVAAVSQSRFVTASIAVFIRTRTVSIIKARFIIGMSLPLLRSAERDATTYPSAPRAGVWGCPPI